MNEIEDRLRKGARTIYLATESIVADDVSDMMNKAADEIASLRAQLAEAVGLLGPFAECVRANDRRGDGVLVSVDPIECHKVMVVELGDLRRAREFIERVGK